MLSGSLSAGWRHSGDLSMPSTTLGVQGQGGAPLHSHTLSSETLASMYEQSTDRSRGVASEAGSLQQQSSMLKNASDPSLRSTGSSFADLESAGYARHGLHRQEDSDIFSAVGGMELGADADLESLGADLASTSGHEPLAEPSRTIFVRHTSPAAGDEELLAVFRVFGDVRHIFTISKHRGFVMVTYFDLRSAVRAQATLNGSHINGINLGSTGLEVHFCAPKGDPTVNQGTVTVFNLDPDTTNEHLVWLFSKFGDVKDIRESPDRSNQKFITFYDTRHALEALRLMNKAEHLGKLPANISPQLAASLSQHTMHGASAGIEGVQRAQFLGGQAGSAGMWDSQHSPEMLQAQLAAARQSASRTSSQPGTSSPSPLPGTSPAGQAFLAPARQDLQVPPSVTLNLQPQQQTGQVVQGMVGGQQQAVEQMAAGVRPGLHVSDSASSMSSVAGQAANQLFAAAAAAGRSPLGGGAIIGAHGHGAHGHVSKAVPSLATLSEAQALEEQAGLYAAAGSMLAGTNGQSGIEQAGGSNAANVNATANMLMGLQLGQDQQLWALQQQMAGAGQGQVAAAASGQAGLWAAAAAAAAGSLYGPAAQQQATAAAAAANLQALRNLQELQARQQAQQQQVAMAANLALLQGQALSAADLNAAAAQLLHIAGLGNALGQSPAAAAAAAYLPAAAGLGMSSLGGLSSSASSLGGLSNAAVTQQLLQNAMAMSNMGVLGALGTMQAALGGQAGTSRLSGSFGSLTGAMAGSQGGSSSHHHGNGGRDGAGGSRGGGRLSRRTTDPAAELERKLQQEKLYALDPVKIRSGEDKRTTLMIKNIPNKYTQKMLLATIDEQFKGSYDFFYLPIDFKNKCNVGYAFINMINPYDIIALVERFNNRRWERFNSEKVCSISYARIQGRAALVAHFQNSSLMHEDKRCRPILFTANGTETTDPEAFQNDPSLQPVPTATSGGAVSQSGSQQTAPSGGGGAPSNAAPSVGIGPARLRAAAAAAAAANASGGSGSGGGAAVSTACTGGQAVEDQRGCSVGPPGQNISAGG